MIYRWLLIVFHIAYFLIIQLIDEQIITMDMHIINILEYNLADGLRTPTKTKL